MDKFLVFSVKEIPLAVHRERVLKERMDDEQTRVELEKNTAVNHLPYQTEADVEQPSRKSQKKKAKKMREAAAEEVAQGADYTDMPSDEDEVKELDTACAAVTFRAGAQLSCIRTHHRPH